MLEDVNHLIWILMMRLSQLLSIYLSKIIEFETCPNLLQTYSESIFELEEAPVKISSIFDVNYGNGNHFTDFSEFKYLFTATRIVLIFSCGNQKITGNSTA